MSVVNTDLVIYTSANMPEGNTTIAGGDIRLVAAIRNSGIRAILTIPLRLISRLWGRVYSLKVRSI